MKLLPAFVKDKLQKKPYLSNIINNIGWLVFDKIFRLGIGLFIGAWMARYLGPEQLGLLNYILAIMSFLTVIASFGLNNIVVRELVKEKEQTDKIMGSAFCIQLITSFLSFLILFSLSLFLFDDTCSQLISIVIGFSLLFKPMDIIRYYFEANVQSKYIVWAENCSFIISSLLKVILILNKASLLAIASLFLVEAIIISLFILSAYYYNKQHISTWHVSLSLIKQNIRQSWPLILSGLSILVYMQIDKVMLGQMLDYEAVGIYTAATKLSEIWYFIPMVIMSSVNPALIQTKAINEKNYYDKLTLLINLLVLISIIIAVVTTFLSPYIIYILYGDQYQSSALVLTLHIWTGIFVSMGVASSQWFIVENLQILHFYRALLGAFVNLFLNYLLIPSYGVYGAAAATLIAMMISDFLADLTHPKMRVLFFMKLKSFNIVKTIKMAIKYIKNISKGVYNT